MRHLLLSNAHGDGPSRPRKSPASKRSTTTTTTAAVGLVTLLVLVVSIFADAALAAPPRPVHRQRCQHHAPRDVVPAVQEAGPDVAVPVVISTDDNDESLTPLAQDAIEQPTSTLLTAVQPNQSSAPIAVSALPLDQAAAATTTTATTTLTTRTIQISFLPTVGAQGPPSSIPSPMATVPSEQQQQQAASLTGPDQGGAVAMSSNNNNNNGSTNEDDNEDDQYHEPPAITTPSAAAKTTTAATAEDSAAPITKPLPLRLTTIARTVTHMVTATVTTFATPSTFVSISASANSTIASSTSIISSSSGSMASLLGVGKSSVVTLSTAAFAASRDGTATAAPVVTPGPAGNGGRLDDNGYQRGYSPATV